MATIHERAKLLLSIFGERKRSAERRRIMREVAQQAVDESDDRQDQKSLDYREWRPDWDWSMPLMVGSGRRAQWCHQTYRWRACVARALHGDVGLSGDAVRRMADWLVNLHGGGCGWAIPPMPPVVLSTEFVDRLRRRASAHDLSFRATAIGAYLREGAASAHAIAVADWRLWQRTVADPAWGRLELARTVYRLERDPSYHTPSQAVGLIRILRGDPRGQDYRGCSGSEWLTALADRPDLWDDMLARAPAPVRGKVGTLDAVYTLHGLGAPAEFDHCLVLGLDYEIRVRSAEYNALKRQRPAVYSSHDPAWQFLALQ